MDDPKIGFIGAGTLGKGLALALATRRYRIVAASSLTPSSAEALATQIPGCEAVGGPQELADRCDLVFITTPDELIGQVASQITWRRGQGAVHCSGAEPLEILEPAASLGALTGSFHPFQTFACVETPKEAARRLKGVTVSVEGQGWLLKSLKHMARRLGGKAIILRPEDRPIYHASAVMSCGHLVALIKAAIDMWQIMGLPQEEALPIILPLAETTLANLSKAGPYASLTGPVPRGDTVTLQKHLDALEQRLPKATLPYASLALASLPVAGAKVTSEKLEEMDRLIRGYALKNVSRFQGQENSLEE